jgi:transcriptional regulator with XRE-family HTH domain
LLRLLRAEAGLTQEELAAAAGVSPRTVSDLERGLHQTAHKDTAGLLADALILAAPVHTLFVAAARGRVAPAEVLAARAHAAVTLADVAARGPVAATADGLPGRAVPRELPADVGVFTGREAELAELDRLGAAAGPVVSVLSGTAGVGKTALAVRWAHRVAGLFPDGQLYVNLRGYDPDQPMIAADALAGFLRALGMASQDVPLPEAERAARYRSAVAGRRMLVVLDNAATVQQVRPLLPGSATVQVVVTSRDSLAGLVALDGACRLDLDLLPAADAVALLRALIGVRADADQVAAQTLADQCVRLPLALRIAAELAATRLDTPLAKMTAELAGLQDRLDLLTAGDDPHGAVASVFSWSCRHLPAETVHMFGLLGPRWPAPRRRGPVSCLPAWPGRT